MTTSTIVGKVCDELGLVRQTWLEQGRRRPEVRSRHFAAGANEYRSFQPAYIELQLDHWRRIGDVRHLERRHGQLWAVAELDAGAGSIPPNVVYFSPSISFKKDGSDIELRSLSLVAEPATCGAHPVHELRGDIRQAAREAWRLKNPLLVEILEHAKNNTAGTKWIYEHPAPTPPGVGGYLDNRGATIAAGQLASSSSGRTMRLPDGTYAEIEYRPGRIIGVR